MKSSNTFRFEWSEAAVAEFWNHISAQPQSEGQYFSLQRGKSVLDYLNSQVDLSAGTIADVGCGKGHMLSYMLNQGIQCVGLDTSSQSVATTNDRLASNQLFLGAHLMRGFDGIPLENSSVSGILFMETIEHLFTDKVVPMMAEIMRVLRPGGFVFVTTPNNENLAAHEVGCGTCGCVFHPVQHMRSFDAASLKGVMSQSGFKTGSCRPVVFWPDWKIYLRQMGQSLTILCPSCGAYVNAPKRSLYHKLANLQTHTLAYIGYKA